MIVVLAAMMFGVMTVASCDDILVTAGDCNTACPTEIYNGDFFFVATD